ncbi:hypothetical protein SFC66_00905 [Terribacillus saccharophilus]|uniref:hypothetical protein n=1 Tax=Terribacillus saccharophilus TaxID=361277 RepID=UPI0039820824
MVMRLFFVLVTLGLAIAALFLAAANPTGPNTVSFDEPMVIWLNIGVLVLLFIPPLLLSFFRNLVVKIISAIYQVFIAFAFGILILVGVLIPDAAVIFVGISGVFVTICSIIVTIVTGLKKRDGAEPKLQNQKVF